MESFIEFSHTYNLLKFARIVFNLKILLHTEQSRNPSAIIFCFAFSLDIFVIPCLKSINLFLRLI